MMRKLIGCAFAALGLLVVPANAQDTGRAPVVVELFTSQGCSSCPPADELLHELAQQDDVIALSLHVDYWDYIGWKDIFAQPAFTARQKAYARAHDRRSIYTPQVVIGGRDVLVGHDSMKIVMTIEDHRRANQYAEIKILSRNADDTIIRVSIEPRQPKASKPPKGNVQLVRYTPEATVDVRRGENAGQTLRYTNIVREWTSLGPWDGEAAEMQLDLPGAEPAVLILQEDGQRDVLAAAQLK